MATWLGEKSQEDAMSAVGKLDRLTSYHFIKEQKISKKKFVDYCRNVKNKKDENK